MHGGSRKSKNFVKTSAIRHSFVKFHIIFSFTHAEQLKGLLRHIFRYLY